MKDFTKRKQQQQQKLSIIKHPCEMTLSLNCFWILSVTYNKKLAKSHIIYKITFQCYVVSLKPKKKLEIFSGSDFVISFDDNFLLLLNWCGFWPIFRWKVDQFGHKIIIVKIHKSPKHTLVFISLGGAKRNSRKKYYIVA